MRWIPFVLTTLITIVLIYVLNRSWGGVPPVGRFLSPQHGLWQNAEPVNADFSMELQSPDLKDQVEVYFDERMVPHIFAQNEPDAYFVQGYIHAKFRLWQMDFQTRAAAGRLSEILGPGADDVLVNFDRNMRRLGMVYAAEIAVEEAKKDPATNTAIGSYTAGVNYYINNLKKSQYPIEYKLLNYEPEQWSFLKTALFLKYMSLDLAGREDDFEMTNARSLFTKEDFNLIYPITQDSLDPIVPKGTIFDAAGLQVKVPAVADSLYFTFKAPDTTAITPGAKPDKDNGSNNWAVAGSKTQSGRPILCNDPHLSLNLPALWFEMQIHTPEFNVYGATFPGAPNIIIGFNDNISWGFTNGMRDVRDYYEIQFKDESRSQYLFNNEWMTTSWRVDTLKINGRPDYIDSVAYVRLGDVNCPVMYDRSYTGGRSAGDRYFAVRWKAHDPSNEQKLFYGLNHAKNYNDYYEAARNLQTPGQNIVFAAKTGEIAIWAQGSWPGKWHRQGDFIMPGSDTTFLWKGMIPQQENPHQVNPERGFVSSANQFPTDTTYPYYLGGSYPPYRGLIINRYLNNMTGITPKTMQQLQVENYNVFAEMARPLLLKNIDEASLEADERKYLDIFRSWNLRNDVNEKGITVFTHWFDSLEVEVWRDEIRQTDMLLLWPDESTLLEGLLRDSAFKFINNINTPESETLPFVVTTAFKKAVTALKQLEASGKLEWAKFKATGVRHLLRQAPLSRFNLPVGGGTHIINATKDFHGPSWRMIVHMTDDIEAYGIYPGGQSGNPGSKYYDSFVDKWAAGEYYTLWFMKKGEEKDNRVKARITFSKS